MKAMFVKVKYYILLLEINEIHWTQHIQNFKEKKVTIKKEIQKLWEILAEIVPMKIHVSLVQLDNIDKTLIYNEAC